MFSCSSSLPSTRICCLKFSATTLSTSRSCSIVEHAPASEVAYSPRSHCLVVVWISKIKTSFCKTCFRRVFRKNEFKVVIRLTTCLYNSLFGYNKPNALNLCLCLVFSQISNDEQWQHDTWLKEGSTWPSVVWSWFYSQRHVCVSTMFWHRFC